MMDGNLNKPAPLAYDLDQNQLENLLSSWGEPRYRSGQIWKGLYQQLWSEPAEFTNLPAGLRERLADNLQFSPLKPAQVLRSSDGETIKTLFTLPDKRAIEARFN